MTLQTPPTMATFAANCDYCGLWELDCRWMIDRTMEDETVCCGCCEESDAYPVTRARVDGRGEREEHPKVRSGAGKFSE